MTEKASQVLERLQPGKPRQTAFDKESARTIPDQRIRAMDRLWLVMTEMYLRHWTDHEGEEPNQTWIMGLEDISLEQISQGLRACRDSGFQLPPTLPKFLEMCIGSNGGFRFSGESQCHKIYEPERRIENITAKEKSHAAGVEFFKKHGSGK